MEIPAKLKFVVSAVGIFVCYFYFGVLQERITRGTYGEGEKQERFPYVMALVFSMCAVNYVFAWFLQKFVMNQGEDTTPTKYYALSALTYLVAMVTSNKALTWVNYPTQVVGKSCKPIPVMILGVLFGRKRYPLLKYFFVFLIVVGVSLFIYKDKAASPKSQSDSSKDDGGFDLWSFIGIGELLLLVSLTCDGLTGAVQERMKSEHATKSLAMMIEMNKWSIIYLGIVLSATGELSDFSAFVQRHPDIVWQLGSVSLASALGQYFIFMCVSDFGPLPCSIITTTRKFFTVLASVVIFGNALSQRQWIGASLVFAGLFLDMFFGKKPVAAAPSTGKRVEKTK